MSDHTHDPSEVNRAVWHHYQGVGVDAFVHSTARLRGVARAVRKRCPAPATVLTVGIGDATLERSLVAVGYELRAIDPDETTVERVRAAGIAATCAVVEDLPFENAQFDLVVASEVLEHLTDSQSALGLAEVRRVLRPGGWFIGTVPYNENLSDQSVVCPDCRANFHRWGHCRSFDDDAMRRELANDFDVVSVSHRAFVAFRGRSLKRLLSGSAHWILGRAGAQISHPNILFVARRRAV